jgi:preprotein translocase subunit YajC
MMNILLMASPDGQGGGFGAFIPLLAVIVIFYFFMIRPQMKRQKEVRNFRESLKKGDKVLTLGGIYGKVVEIQDTTIILEIADNVKVKVEKAGIVKDNSDIAQQK